MKPFLLVLAVLTVAGGVAALFLSSADDAATGEDGVSTAPPETLREAAPGPDEPRVQPSLQEPPRDRPPIAKPAPPAKSEAPDAGTSLKIAIQHGLPATAIHGHVLTPLGDPLPSAVVHLLQVTGATPIASGQRARVAEPATTDAKGGFRFAGLDGGSGYLLRVEHGDYPPLDFPNVEVAVGVDTALPDLRLTHGASIQGTVTRDDSQPAVRATVALFSRESMSQDDPVKQVLTDDDGGFAFKNLGLGSYRITVSADGMQAARSGQLMLTATHQKLVADLRLEPGFELIGRVVTLDNEPIADAIVEARPRTGGGDVLSRTTTHDKGGFVLKGLGAEELRIDVRCKGFGAGSLVPVSAGTDEVHVIRLEQHAGITGFVLDRSTKEPIKSFGLMLWMIGKGDVLNECLGGMREFQKSPDGSFMIEDVPPGAYRIQAFANDHGPAFTMTFDVRRKWVHSVTIELGRGASLSGLVTDRKGAPLAGATVRLLDNAWRKSPISRLIYGDLSEKAKPVRSDGAGRFRFENLGPGTVQLRAKAEGTIELVKVDVVVNAEQENDAGTLVLQEGGDVDGAVVGASGVPMRGAKVTLMVVGGDARDTTTDDKGEYSFRNLPAGQYILTALPPSGVGGNPLGVVIAAQKASQSVTVIDGETTHVNLAVAEPR